MKFIYFLFLLVFVSATVFGQTVGDFQSHQTGDWDVASTWERWNGASWVTPAPSIPSSSDGVITILNGHIVTVVADATVDQLTVASGAILALDPTNAGVPITLTLNDGAGTDLTVNGSGQLNLNDDFIEGSVVFVSSSASVLVSGGGAISVIDPTLSNFDFQPNSTYTHNSNGGVIPFSFWGSNSTCLVNGYTNSPITGLDQAFYNFTWNCAGQATPANLGLTSATSFVGDFNVLNTNNQNLQLNTTGTYNINFSKNFTVSGNSRINFITTAGGSATLNIAGDFTFGSTGAASLLASTGTLLLNVAGNFTHSGGTLTKSGASGTATIVFNGTLAQNYISSGTATVSGTVTYQVNSGSILDLGTSALIGTGASFTLNSGGTLRVGSTDSGGAIQASTSLGNIRVAAASRTYSSGSTIIYNGAGAQVTGPVWASNATLSSGNVNLTISNSSGVTMNSNITIGSGRTLTLNSGSTLAIGNNTLALGGSLAGTGSLIGNTSGNLNITGTGSLGSNLTLTGTTQLNSFTLNRTSSGLVILGSNLTILDPSTTGFVQTNGDLDLNGHTLQISGIYNRTAGSLLSNSSSSLTVDGSGTLPASFSFGGGLALNTLTLNRSGVSLTTAASLGITNLNLLSGTFANSGTITIATGGVITRQENGGMSTAPTAATSYDVIYNVSAPTTTGVELPTGTTQLNNLTKQGSDVLSLNSPITINGILTLSNGSFDAGSNAMDIKGNFVSNSTSTLTGNTTTFSGTTTISGSTAPTFGNMTVSGTLTPPASYQINGNLINNGTLNSGSGTITFGGTTTISGSSTSSFNNVIISGTLTAPSSTINVAGNFTDNGTFNSSTGTVVFNGTTTISGSANPNFNSITISGILNAPTTLALAGNFTNNGTFNRGTGTVLFNGSSGQQITGSVTTDFNNITVTNVAGPPAVSVQHNENLRGVLTLSNNSIFDADGSSNTSIFTLVSTADNPTSDASVAALGTGASVTGKVTAQRYMSIEGPNNTRIYRYISSPVQNATAADLQNEIPITGTFTTPSSCSGCTAANQSMWSYNEAVLGNINLGYVDFPNTANTETLVPAVGYEIFVRGNIIATPVWDLTGPINSGNIDFNVTFHSSGSSPDDGWNLVGNPYPSTIDWNAAGWTKTNLTNTIYMRDNGVGGIVATWNGLTGTNGGSQNIAMGQGFWVQANGAAPSLLATESVKTAGTSTTFFRAPTNLKDLLRITMVQGTNRDESIINFRSDATVEYDHVDAWKWKNSSIFNLSSVTSSGTKLAINSLPAMDCSSTVKLDVSDVTPGNYSLEFSQVESFDGAVNILLNDKFTNKTFDVKSGTPYAFTVTSDAASYNSDRFSILFTLPNIDPTFSVATKDVCSNQDASVTLVGTKQGANYAIYKDNNLVLDNAGTGSDMTLSISKSILVSGVNSFAIKSYVPTCSSASLEKTITINMLEIPDIASVTSTKSCLAGAITLQASGTIENSVYHWYDSESATIPIAGQSLNVFQTPVLQKSRTYYVAAANTAGCEGARKPITAEVIQFDPVKITSETSGVLASSYATGNQWYVNDQLILNADQSEFIPKSSGTYSVKVDLGNGCVTSDTFDYLVTGTENGVSNIVQVYPNPVYGKVSVLIPNTMGVRKSVIVNALGQEIGSIGFKEKEGQLSGEFDMSNRPSGVYLLKLDLSNGQNFHYNLIKK